MADPREEQAIMHLLAQEMPPLSPVDIARCVSVPQRVHLLGAGRVPVFTTATLMIIGFCLMLLFFAYTGVTAPESLAQAEEWLFAMLLGYPLGLTELIEQVLWMSGLFLLGLGVTGSLICSALDVRTEVTKS